MKVKGIPYAEVKAKALQNPDVMAVFLPPYLQTGIVS